MPGEFSGPIQIPPLGLLGFLQLKSPAGMNPSWMRDDVSPGIDLWDLWMQARVESLAVQTALVPTNAGGFISAPIPIVVPDREMWWVENFSIHSFVQAGDTVNKIRPALRYNNLAPSAFGRLGEDIDSGVAGQNCLVGAGGFFAPPGSQLGIWFGNVISGTTVQCNMYVRRSVLPI
jgi:hypothetical protein